MFAACRVLRLADGAHVFFLKLFFMYLVMSAIKFVQMLLFNIFSNEPAFDFLYVFRNCHNL